MATMTRRRGGKEERVVRIKYGGEGHRSHDGQPAQRQRRSPQKILQ